MSSQGVSIPTSLKVRMLKTVGIMSELRGFPVRINEFMREAIAEKCEKVNAEAKLLRDSDTLAALLDVQAEMNQLRERLKAYEANERSGWRTAAVATEKISPAML
jgi:hypothetical protein